MSIPDSPRARPRAQPAASVGASDDDQTTWLVTFSDLVLQLFAFVIVWVVIAAPRHGTIVQPILAQTAGPRMEVSASAAADLPAVVTAPLFEPVEVVSAAPPTTDAPARLAPPSRLPDLVVEEATNPPPATAESGATAARLAALGRHFEEFLAAQHLTPDASVTAGESDLVLAMSDTIGFGPGSAEIRAEARPILDEIRALAASMPDFGIDVAGHTDDVPIKTAAFPSNLELSLARAANVVNALVAGDEDLQVRTVAAGFAEYRPVAANEDARGRAQNRRVEIRFVPLGYSTP